MSCLTRFESKSARVKGIAFHPKRPWVLASLHNGLIQLWDYRMCTLIEKFDEHEGPVRGIDFHSNQPLFVSGGDDYKIKVWNYKTKRCLFTLLGHVDYIRTTFFHKEYPWIISASDDQTIRIWNWQSRAIISVLTGHSHYVMCAQFHPKEDLVVSASLDQTVRVWDITGLRKKNVVPTSTTGLEEHIRSVTSGSGGHTGGTTELFGTSDAVIKHVLEGHDRGVNWASFHPVAKIIISAADDRQVKIWKMNDLRAWELDTCRGHYNNVSCAIFHPRGDMILSNSEDKSIRIWDMTRRTCLTSIRRENDRFWVLASHPTANLFAAGHDNGIVVFKLERERPASIIHKDTLYYVSGDHLRKLDFSNNHDEELLQLKKCIGRTKPYSLAYNPAENMILLVSRGLTTENASYELIPLPTDGSNKTTSSSSDTQRKPGVAAVWVQRNKFAVLDGSGMIYIKNMQHQVVSTIEVRNAEAIFTAGIGNILIKDTNSLILYDVTNKRVLNTMKNVKARRVVWSPGHKFLAVISKLFLYIYDRDLELKMSVHENVSIKSGVWDDSGVFIYTTSTHIKYAIINGDHGIIRTLDVPIYLTKVTGSQAYCLNRKPEVNMMIIDPTEYKFKLALIDRRYEEVINMVKGAKLVGQSMIAYLQKKGYPEIALHFVKDERTRFALALECGNLKIAFDVAKSLNDNLCWEKLGELALMCGNHSIVEKAYQKTKNYDKLNFLYLITGNLDKSRKMMKIAESRKDISSQYQTALSLGDMEEKIKILNNAGQKSLGYLTAVTHGIENDGIKSIEARLEEENMPIPKPENDSKLLLGNVPVQQIPTENEENRDLLNWPLLIVAKDLFETSIPTGTASSAGGNEVKYDGSSLLAMQRDVEDAEWDNDDDDFLLEGTEMGSRKENGVGDDDGYEDAEEGGWDIDDNIEIPADIAARGGLQGDALLDGFVAPGPGRSPLQYWNDNSNLISDKIQSGSFNAAMRYLSEQAGVVDYKPYKKVFTQLYARSRTTFRGLPGVPCLYSYIQKNPQEQISTRNSLPMPALKLSDLTEKLQSSYQLTTKGKFVEAIDSFRNILISIPLLSVDNRQEEQEAKNLRRICTQYIIGISMEVKRKALSKTMDPKSPEFIKLNLEMACYFTHCELQPSHLILTLRTAQQLLLTHKNMGLAASMAQRLLDLAPPAGTAEKARKILQICERDQSNSIELNYDARNPFTICPASFTPIYHGSDKVKDPLSEAYYLPKYKGEVCRVSQVSEIGKDCVGLRINYN